MRQVKPVQLSGTAQETLRRLDDGGVIDATELDDGAFYVAILHRAFRDSWTVPVNVLRGLVKRGLVARQYTSEWRETRWVTAYSTDTRKRRDTTFVLSDEGRKVL